MPGVNLAQKDHHPETQRQISHKEKLIDHAMYHRAEHDSQYDRRERRLLLQCTAYRADDQRAERQHTDGTEVEPGVEEQIVGMGGVLLTGPHQDGGNDAVPVFGIMIKIKLSQLSQIL